MLKRLLNFVIGQQPQPDCFIKSSAPIILPSEWPQNFEKFSLLLKSAPCFPVHGSQIKIIHEPEQFYETLIEKSQQAKYRIVLASLYLGTGPLEETLVKSLYGSLKKNENLKIKVLVDFNRGNRGERNSKTMLQKLLVDFAPKCEISMYHSPSLRGIFKKLAPPRYNELVGLQHMKVYLFDDSVIISGANLSNDYFTNRQDRYIVIEDKNLANFYEKLVEKVQEFSLCVKSSNLETKLHENWRFVPYEGNKEEFIEEAKGRLTEFFNEVFNQQKILFDKIKDADTWIFPLIEMGQLGIHHDSVVTKNLISSSLNSSILKLATGYFNLTQEYMNIIRNNCLASCSILMAHPNVIFALNIFLKEERLRADIFFMANGFMGAKGPAGGIPAAYTLIARKFYENLIYSRQEERVNFFEYERNSWTYHAKGLWYYLPESSLPNLTVIGSSNFGERSVNRDLETQICIVTKNETLKLDFQNEIDHLYHYGKKAEQEIIKRAVPLWVKIILHFKSSN